MKTIDRLSEAPQASARKMTHIVSFPAAPGFSAAIIFVHGPSELRFANHQDRPAHHDQAYANGNRQL